MVDATSDFSEDNLPWYEEWSVRQFPRVQGAQPYAAFEVESRDII